MQASAARPAPAARRDAARNRERILTAAREVVANHGQEADVREIARVAGVGMGTLYRHFGTKQVLLAATLAPEVDDWARSARAAATSHDAWAGLRRFLTDALARQAAHRGLAQRYANPQHTPDEHDACRRALQPIITELVARAHVEGSLRADVRAADIALLLIGLARITEVSDDPSPDPWRRQLDLVLDGLRASAAAVPDPSPPQGAGIMLTPDDHLEIHRVLADYGHVVDDHDWDRAEDVFTPDVTFETGAGGTVLHGIEEIVATFRGRNMYAHVTTNTTLCEESDGTVSAHSKFIGFPNEGAPVTGDYHDEIARTPAGWRLRHRRAEIRQRRFFE